MKATDKAEKSRDIEKWAVGYSSSGTEDFLCRILLIVVHCGLC